MKAEALPQGCSPQQAKLWALTQALKYAKGKQVNIYTDSSYAFATLLVHGTIYKERGLLTAGGGERRLKTKKKFFSFWKQSGSGSHPL